MSETDAGRVSGWCSIHRSPEKDETMNDVIAHDELLIPVDIEEAILGLKGISELINASEWKRAALVFAFTYEGKPGGRTDQNCSVGKKSLSEFADLRISGLASRTSVRKYRDAWKRAVTDGWATADLNPGDIVVMPDVDWQEYVEGVKPSREPREPSKGKRGTEGHSESDRSPTGDSEGISEPADKPEDIPGPDLHSKRTLKALGIVEGIEARRVAEAYRGGITRLKDALTNFVEPDANREVLFLHMAQALGDLVTALPEA